MRLRRNVVAVVAAGLALGACGGSDDDAGIDVEEIAAPAAEPELETSPSVAKTGRVEMEVGRSEVAGAAQAVVDLATSSKVGGFLTSSVVDLEDEYGAAAILVHVPAERFEQTVTGLGDIGEVTRQEMAGESLPEPGPAASSAARREARTQAAYAPIDVVIAGRRPAPPPDKEPIERALSTAKSISLAIVSGAILAAGAVVPVAAILLALFLLWSLVIRRLRLRWDGP